MRKSIIRLVFALSILFAAVTHSSAAVQMAPNVTIAGDSYRAFLDNTTSLGWLDLDNFWNNTDSYNSINTKLSGSGYHLATLPELLTLQSSMPAVPANFAAEVVTVGGNYVGKTGLPVDRDLMWGIYEDGNSADGVSYSFRQGGDLAWSFGANAIGASDSLPSIDTFNRDLGAWVVSNVPVPEPGAFAVWAIGGIMLGIGRAYFRRLGRNQIAAEAAGGKF